MLDYTEQAELIRERCRVANSETTVADRIETVIRDLLQERGVTYLPTREKRVVNKRKRIDSQFGAVITEYKQAISSDREWQSTTLQLVEYIESEYASVDIRDDILGIVTDGQRIRFILFNGGVARPTTPAEIDERQLRRWIDSLQTLERRGLTPANLVDDFAVLNAQKNRYGQQLAIACYNALERPTQKTWMLRTEWRRLFAQSIDHRKTPVPHATAYRRAFGLEASTPVDSTRALFALQTAYAIIVKLVALRVLSEVRIGIAAIRFDQLAAMPDQELQQEMERLEDGHLLRDFQIDNLLEGDFFSWYADRNQWNTELSNAIKNAVTTLSDYEGRGTVLNPNVITDIFRQLYQRVIPPEVRHDLGEYYTPRWLAQATLEAIPKRPGWKGLDPCGGSGTFVVEMIAAVLNEMGEY